MYNNKISRAKTKFIRIGISYHSPTREYDTEKSESDFNTLEKREHTNVKKGIRKVIKNQKEADKFPLHVEEIYKRNLPIWDPPEPEENILDSVQTIEVMEPVPHPLDIVRTPVLSDDGIKMKTIDDRIQLITYIITMIIASFVGGCYLSSILI